MIVVTIARADNWGGTTGKSGAAEIVILVFNLGGPVRREHVFKAAADGVAVVAVSGGGKGNRNAAGGDIEVIIVAPGKTALGVKQRRPPCVAEPAGDRA